MTKEEIEIADTGLGNAYGGLTIVELEDGKYLKMGAHVQDTYSGPLTEEQFDAFFILFPHCNRRTVE